MSSSSNVAEHVTFGPYRLRRQIALGGMARIWLADVDNHEHPVVLKMIRPEYEDDIKYVTMFLQEAALGLELQHPNLVEVVDFGQINGRYYLEMEYLPGLTLRQAASHACRRLPISMLLASMIDTCHTLAYLHECRQGPLVHRDVTPENLIITEDGRTKLLDLGIAALPALRQTSAGERKGKVSYMPPEAFGSDPVDGRRDVYGVGLILYEMVTGQKAFTGPSEPAIIHAITTGALQPPSEVVDDLPDGLEHVILTALAPDPSDRYPGTRPIARALQEILWTRDSRPPHEIVADTLRTLGRGRPDTGSAESSIDIMVEEDPGSLPEARVSSSMVQGEVVLLFPDEERASAPVEFERRGVEDVTLQTQSLGHELERPGDAALAYFDLGLAAQLRGDIDEAIAAWEHATQLDPDNSRFAFNLKKLLKQQARQKEMEALE